MKKQLGIVLSPLRKFVRGRKRFARYSSEYFNHAVLPGCKDLLWEQLELSQADAKRIFDAFGELDA